MSMLYSNLIKLEETSVIFSATYASIIGSNIGAFLTPIGALAGIMFSATLHKYEVKYTFFDFAKHGALIATPTIFVALLGLLLVS